MRFLRSTLIIGFIVCFVAALNADTNLEASETTTEPTTTTTTTAPTTTSTTTVPTTTTSTTTKTTTTTTETTTTSTTTTTAASTTTTTSTTTASTTTSTVPSTTTTTTTSASTTTSTTPATTTTTKETTTTTTTHAPSTTTVAPPNDVMNFVVPKDSKSPCFRARFALSLNITYLAKVGDQVVNSTVLIDLYDPSNNTDFGGECNQTYETLDISFRTNWRLLLNYTLEKNTYKLDQVLLKYTTDAATFPNVLVPDEHTTINGTGLNQFAVTKGQSYKCFATSTVGVSKVNFVFSKYQAEAFLGPNNTDFDTAVECAADQTTGSELVPIIVGSALAVLVIFVLIAYIIGRRKHRPGYQQV